MRITAQELSVRLRSYPLAMDMLDESTGTLITFMKYPPTRKTDHIELVHFFNRAIVPATVKLLENGIVAVEQEVAVSIANIVEALLDGNGQREICDLTKTIACLREWASYIDSTPWWRWVILKCIGRLNRYKKSANEFRTLAKVLANEKLTS